MLHYQDLCQKSVWYQRIGLFLSMCFGGEKKDIMGEKTVSQKEFGAARDKGKGGKQ